MPEVWVKMKRGEKRPIYVEEMTANGVLNFAAPSATVTLYDGAGRKDAVVNAVAVTGASNGSQTTLQVWYTLDATRLTPGFYTLAFSLRVSSSDGTVRQCTPSVGIEILPDWL